MTAQGPQAGARTGQLACEPDRLVTGTGDAGLSVLQRTLKRTSTLTAMLNRYRIRAALAAAALLPAIACSDDEISGPGTPDVQTVALVELEGTRPAFYIQNSDGTGRTRIHFTGAVDEVPGNSPLVPALTDANILAIRSVKWSPDGTRIAFVATVAADQAEVVVMKADGTDARIVSVNYAYVLGDVDWSPDRRSRRLRHGHAARPSRAGGVRERCGRRAARHEGHDQLRVPGTRRHDPVRVDRNRRLDLADHGRGGAARCSRVWARYVAST